MASAGCLTQIAAKGPQDKWLTCDAIITFWKGGYRRYTTFALCEIEQTFNGQVGFGRRMVATLSRSGDLVAQTYLHMELAPVTYLAPAPPVSTAVFVPGIDGASWTNAVGHAMITEARVEIGGHEFDRQTGEYLQIWEELSAPPEKLLTEMTGFRFTVAALMSAALVTQFLYVPLRFWFNRFYEQALPLIALQYHEVRIHIDTRAATQLQVLYGAFADPALPANAALAVFPTDPDNMILLVNYVFLDTMERRMFAQQAHEYLIDQVQFTGAESHQATVSTLNSRQIFNHPTQEIIWVGQQSQFADGITNPFGATPNGKDYFNYNGQPDVNGFPTDPFLNAQIDLNGHDRTLNHPIQYYRLVQPYEHHTRFPLGKVYLYSFALYPEDVKPSGSVNMSRIDNVNMRFTFPTVTVPANLQWTGEVRIYARSKNVMKIVSGMAGLMYAN